MRLNYSSENRYVRNNEDQQTSFNIWYILYTINNRIIHQQDSLWNKIANEHSYDSS